MENIDDLIKDIKNIENNIKNEIKKINIIVIMINENEVEITSIEFENRSVSVYQLNVETDDVYYANDILTHNDK